MVAASWRRGPVELAMPEGGPAGAWRFGIVGRQEVSLGLLRFRRGGADVADVDDRELVRLFASRPDRAWDLFIDRYADLILTCLRQLGFDHDQAMDRFVYVCEKLSEDRFRRLRTIRHAGDQGDLTPWLRAVVRNLSVSWAWSVHGRRRLFRSIERLPERERRVFELYFWQGLAPSQIHGQLAAERPAERLELVEVLEILETLFGHLSDNQRWRLMSQLIRHRRAAPIDEGPATGEAVEPRSLGPTPEEALLDKERRAAVREALAGLSARQRLALRLRYDEALSLADVAEIVGVSVSTVKNDLRSAVDGLRSRLGGALGVAHRERAEVGA